MKNNSQSGFSNIAQLVCIGCGEVYGTDITLHHCKKCGDILDVTYTFPKKISVEDWKKTFLERRKSMDPVNRSGVWRFRELFPFVADGSKVVTLQEGNTPLYKAPVCGKYVGLSNLYLKHQGLNPTGSFKDPGMTAAITQANILGMRAVVCASTGNTSASMAAYSARAGLLPIVILPEGQISYGKLAQALDYGALTIQIGGDFDRALELVQEVAPELGVYIANSINPFRIEGQKTMMIEVLEQLEWNVPDRIVVPGGNLGNASSVWKALRELRELGFIKKIPKITVVQAEGANPLYRTITSSDQNKLITVHAKTLATAVKIGNPVSWKKALQGIQESDGWTCEVTEQQIADAKAMVGREGIGCEPASALTVAGIKKIVEEGTDLPIDRDEVVVAVLTGNVLKDPEYTARYHRGELYEESTTTMELKPLGPKIEPNFANKLVTIPGDANELRRVISERMAH